MIKVKKLLILLFILSFSFILTNSAQTVVPPTVQPKTQDFVPYTFIAYGDTRNTPEGDNTGIEETAKMIQGVMDEREVSFILHVGDIVDSGGSQDEYDEYWWPEMEDILDEVPIYVAPGNHEYESLSGGDDLELVTFRNNVNNPNNSGQDETYYSFNSPQGDTHFVVLNTEYYFGLEGANAYNETRQAEQMAWLEADLTANTASRIIVMFHRPLWGVNNARVVEEYRPLRAEWHDYLTQNHSVDFVIQGHDHHVYHTVRNDTDYMIIGAGTAALTLPNLNGNYVLEEQQEGDFAFGDQFAISIITATAEGFDVEILAHNGSIVHEFTIDAAADDIYAPIISSPDDLSFEEGTTGQSVSWTVNDINGDAYTITVDGTEEETGTWTDGDVIAFDVSAFTVGRYEVKLEATDSYDNSAFDIVSVQVTAAETTTTTTTAPGMELIVGLLSLVAIGYLFSRKR